MSNDLVLREAGLRRVTCLVRECQLRLYGHVARLPVEDPAHRILSCRDPRGWPMPSGRLQASWLRQVESYLRNMGMAGLASAWEMTRRRPKVYRRQVDAATRRFGVCPPTPDLNFPSDLILFLNRGIGGESFRGSLCRRSTVRAVNQLE